MCQRTDGLRGIRPNDQMQPTADSAGFKMASQWSAAADLWALGLNRTIAPHMDPFVWTPRYEAPSQDDVCPRCGNSLSRIYFAGHSLDKFNGGEAWMDAECEVCDV